jgi:hypothetical protein
MTNSMQVWATLANNLFALQRKTRANIAYEPGLEGGERPRLRVAA